MVEFLQYVGFPNVLFPVGLVLYFAIFLILSRFPCPSETSFQKSGQADIKESTEDRSSPMDAPYTVQSLPCKGRRIA